MRRIEVSWADIGLIWSTLAVGAFAISAANGGGTFQDLSSAGRLTVGLVSGILFAFLAIGCRTGQYGGGLLTAVSLLGVAVAAYSAARQLTAHHVLPLHALGAIFCFLLAHKWQPAPVTTERRLIASLIPLLVVIGMVPIATGVHKRVRFDLERHAPIRPSALTLEDPNDAERYMAWYRTRRTLSGETRGPIVLIEYVDYTCGACRATYEATRKRVLDLNTTGVGVHFEVRSFPLDSRCNAAATVARTRKFSCEAAAAVLLARRKGKEDEVQSWLLRQPIVDGSVVESVVKEQLPGVDVRTLPSVFGSVRDLVAIETHGYVDTTPAFMLNGIRVPPPTTPLFMKILAYEVNVRTAAQKTGDKEGDADDRP